jgi:maltooligosyltrehalose trehalohydrolase
MTGSAISTSTSTSPGSPAASAHSETHRRFPVGAEYIGNGQTHLRVWAPAAHNVTVVVEPGASTALQAESGGYFSGVIAAAAGARYRFRLDDSNPLLPDPASRFQPDGPHGVSEIIDPRAFAWSDGEWAGPRREGQVVYELHLGTFTREGTWAAAERELKELARIGISVIEVMPVAEFEGRFGWGYDGVDLFAPSHLYGRPDDFRRFVDTAHAKGIAVILDVVYNHLGPVGNYLRSFAPAYFTTKYENEWGDAINFDGPDAAPVREFFETNARYWIDEFHLDGLRLDATQQIFDQSSEHILAVIGRAGREAAGARRIVLVAENEPQDTGLVRPIEEGGYGLDAVWNDDFHHSAMVALTGRREAYYSDTRGEPQEFISAAKYGYLFQGQHYHWQRQPRGRPSWGLPPRAFVAFLQNHDQVANSARGRRGHELTSPGRWRAMTALLLLFPETPMLFQGQEFSSSSPFLYFADFEPELAAAVKKGRGEFLTQFNSVMDFEQRATLDDPGDPTTFERCKLDLLERKAHAESYAMHIDLLRLRRESAALGDRCDSIDGAVLSPSAFALRFSTPNHHDDHLLLVNLGGDLCRESFAEPLLAPPVGADWTLLWSSESPAYGGGGTPEVLPSECWRLPGESAIVLSPGPRRQHKPWPKNRRTA